MPPDKTDIAKCFEQIGGPIFWGQTSSMKVDTLEEFYRKHETVALRIRVIDDAGEDIMRHDLLTALS